MGLTHTGNGFVYVGKIEWFNHRLCLSDAEYLSVENVIRDTFQEELADGRYVNNLRITVEQLEQPDENPTPIDGQTQGGDKAPQPPAGQEDLCLGDCGGGGGGGLPAGQD